jgi:hypothetical protein
MVKKQFRDLQSVFCIQLPSNAPVAQLNHMKHLGGIKGPLRVRTFAWVASHGRILTTESQKGRLASHKHMLHVQKSRGNNQTFVHRMQLCVSH